ncbi:CocE/NonD family hydrolase [Paremcibacter congregatus]|uniref:Xaa-Pro dipeptidyl-peptidase C-terminal domain-containing protein n=1 Tax=Paremcibacter congregatus TaxID=2043170 RepID=A0A2G4YT65_9PROT|nr:CocE/NonD family hydrolase [Paremcibacter congregatus]PHZ85477.1 hypothetical protein CRD36_06555 [Paremcibacter congregatus]QDE28028.1 CocE/NonD family hydrolase [Paremcibacter congregatus]
MIKDSYEARVAAWQKGRYAPPPDPDTTPRQPDLIEMARMRDGVGLYTEIFLPAARGSFPTVIHRSPYPMFRPSRHDSWNISRYLDAGFAFVFQMVRGQYKSEGSFRLFKDDVDDGHDCINWLEAQSWCDGNVGMEGSSYAGSVQLYAARTRPKALKCIMPTACFFSLNYGFPYLGGVPGRGWFMQWHKVADLEQWEDLDAPYGDMNALIKHPEWSPAMHRKPLIDAADNILEGDKLQSWREALSHPPGAPYWRTVSFTDEELAELDLPMFFTDGWYDPTIGPIKYFQHLENVQPDRADSYLLVGPWNHSQTYRSQVQDQGNGDRPMPDNGQVDLVAQRLAFFSRYLCGKVDTQVQEDRVKVYVTGLNEWHHFSTFPVPGTVTEKFYFHSEGVANSFRGDGVLSQEAPEEEPTDYYIYDPMFPTPCEVAPICDRRELEIRSDVLVYTSEAFGVPVTILGELKLILYAASNCMDTDWVVSVTEVFPDGRSVPFHGRPGVLRARYREGFDREVMLVPNEATQFEVTLGTAGHQIMVGNRLRISIASAAFPGIDANTNTGAPAQTDVNYKVAKQTIFHDLARPSHLILPVITLGRTKE